MKKLTFSALLLLFAFAVISTLHTSCKKQDAAATCTDGIKNGDESGVDCGGNCNPCPTCTDGIKNGNETGVDCGGNCTPCPSCNDGIKNQNETDIDCGGLCKACSNFMINGNSYNLTSTNLCSSSGGSEFTIACSAPGVNGISLNFPTGGPSPTAGTYTVKEFPTASNEIQILITENSLSYRGTIGTATVSIISGKPSITFTNVTMKDSNNNTTPASGNNVTCM